jgi:hypothetical protein
MDLQVDHQQHQQQDDQQKQEHQTQMLNRAILAAAINAQQVRQQQQMQMERRNSFILQMKRDEEVMSGVPSVSTSCIPAGESIATRTTKRASSSEPDRECDHAITCTAVDQRTTQ